MVDFLVTCQEMGIMPIVRFVKNGIFPIIQIGIPIILVVLGTLDLGKAVIAGKEDEMKNAQKMLIRRCVYAVLVFFVVTIVTLVFSLFGNSNNNNLVKNEGTPSWAECWNEK